MTNAVNCHNFNVMARAKLCLIRSSFSNIFISDYDLSVHGMILKALLAREYNLVLLMDIRRINTN